MRLLFIVFIIMLASALTWQATAKADCIADCQSIDDASKRAECVAQCKPPKCGHDGAGPGTFLCPDAPG
jgi:hypothetical protein